MERLFLAAAAAVLLLASCSNPAAYYSVWNGNNYYASGDYQKANTSYLKALESEQYSGYVHYNIGNVYYSLGEAAAADEEWEKAVFSSSDELLFRTLFNRGVLEFETSRYETAFNLFREALEINPSSISAKINLEYSFRRMNANSNPSAGSAAGAREGAGELPDEIHRVLEFIKRKDAGLWSVREDESELRDGEKDW